MMAYPKMKEKKMKANNIWIRSILVLAVGALCLTLAASISAQVQSQTTTKTGMTTKEITIELGEVVAVEGNSLFVKMSDGSLRDFPNIPENTKITVDGQQLGLHDLKPGMKLQRTTVTSTTPQVVTTVETVTGKIWHVTPPLSVILTLENGENQTFKIPSGQQFTVKLSPGDTGRVTDAWGLRKGMIVTASKITETPVTVTSEHIQVTGTMPADEPVLVAKGSATTGGTTSTTTAEATTPATSSQLPKTGSNFPLLGIVGLLLMCAALGISVLRRTLWIQS
jgi:LPXTG-motif cell wall-anchored protein